MSIKRKVKSILPRFTFQFLRKIIVRPSGARRISNKWLHQHCLNIQGDVLSIGSGGDYDGQSNFYKDYFLQSSSYTTSEVTEDIDSDLTFDVRDMSYIKDAAYDCVYCSGVLEHVDDYKSGLNEITRILKTDGNLLLGLPFRQTLHMVPQDYWRFTEFGIRHLLRPSFEIIELAAIDERLRNFPASYWVKARKVAK